MKRKESIVFENYDQGENNSVDKTLLFGKIMHEER